MTAMRTRTDRLAMPSATAAGSLDPLDLTVAQADLARALRLVGRAEPDDGDLWRVMPLREPGLLRRQAEADEAARVEAQLITPGLEAAA